MWGAGWMRELRMEDAGARIEDGERRGWRIQEYGLENSGMENAGARMEDESGGDGGFRNREWRIREPGNGGFGKRGWRIGGEAGMEDSGTGDGGFRNWGWGIQRPGLEAADADRLHPRSPGGREDRGWEIPREEQSGPRGKALREAGAGCEEEEEEGEEAREGAAGKQDREELGAEPGSGRSAPEGTPPLTTRSQRRTCHPSLGTPSRASPSRWNSASRQIPASPPPPPPPAAAAGGVTPGPPPESPRMVRPDPPGKPRRR
ncbi:inhibitory synaptic factor 1 isoform X2 [Catharus ustulatus]|uniref:inhibitory synaptic factor 1 isoform X2 n=1 Tax=Catharus ustulatus TaxID=91951 RepID=UPI001408942B|nr:inhibitory synaptic factor 1 isoform X2 [Catharus ustulatus]